MRLNGIHFREVLAAAEQEEFSKVQYTVFADVSSPTFGGSEEGRIKVKGLRDWMRPMRKEVFIIVVVGC